MAEGRRLQIKSLVTIRMLIDSPFAIKEALIEKQSLFWLDDARWPSLVVIHLETNGLEFIRIKCYSNDRG